MKKTLLLLIGFLVISACKVGKNYSGANATVTDSFKNINQEEVNDLKVNSDSLTFDSNAYINWFGLFNDPILDSLIRAAQAKNQGVLALAEAVQQAQYGIIVQRAAMLPGFNYQAQVTRGNFIGAPLPNVQGNALGAVGFNWELDFWGKFRRLNEVARANLVASEAGLRSTKISLAATVAQAYFQLQEFRSRQRIAERTLANRDSMLGKMQERFNKGYIPEIDLNQAQIQKAIAAAQVPLWTRLSVQTEQLISQLCGTTPQIIETNVAQFIEADKNINIPVGLPVQLLSRRPDLVAAEQDLLAQNALVGVAQANRLPAISLTGLFGGASNDLTNLSTGTAVWNLGGSVVGPLFNFNQFKRLADIEKSKLKQAQLAYEQTVLIALREVEDALIAIETLQTELVARKEHMIAALNAERLSRARYDQGVTSYLEFLESQRQAFNAQQNYVNTKQQLLSGYTNLYKALGGGWDL